MQNPPSYDLVTIGNYTKDTIVTPGGTRSVDGGGMNYAANAAARLGLKTAVVTRLAREDERVVRAMTAAGIDCYPTYTPASTTMQLLYPGANPDVRILTVTRTAGSFEAGAVTALETRAAVVCASLRGEVGLEVIQALRARGVLLAADMQGFARVLNGESLDYAPWPEMAETLALIDVVKTDAVEAEVLTGEADIYRAARALAALGPREIVLTHKDGLLVHAGGERIDLGFYAARLDGRSGRGDTCIGAYMAKRLSCEPREAGVWAAAVTSLKMERLGPFDRPLAEVEALIRDRYRG